jgi:hypothetical protein
MGIVVAREGRKPAVNILCGGCYGELKAKKNIGGSG